MLSAMKSFSYFPGPANNVIPSKEIDLKTLAGMIRSDSGLVAITNSLRAIKDEEAQKKFKREKLPYVTFSGTFSRRSDDGLLSPSGLIALDLDNIGENSDIKEIQKRIREHCEPALMFVSPRGNGLKVVFAVDINEGEHAEYFIAINELLQKTISVPVNVIDKAAKAVSQACFLCSDSDAIYCESPTVFTREFISRSQRVELAVDESTNDDASRYEAAKKWVEGRESFTPGNRNHFITSLVDTLNRYGASEGFVLQQLSEYVREDFTWKEIEATIRSRYKHKEHHGIAAGITVDNESPDKKTGIPFIRVGTTFYKIIKKNNRYGIEETYHKVWNKDTILQDYKRKVFHVIPKYDDFTMVPDNVNYKPVINNCYNLYSPSCYIPKQGECLWTERLLKHVFGEQYDLGLRYMQILYLHPDRSTVILALVSRERGTGKTTFLNWINMLFVNNVAVISSTDFLSGFNAHYATKNIIAIEETLFEKKLTIEKLKALTTAKFIQINEKFVTPYKIPFYGKIILTSNNEVRFAQIDREEIRFLVRKLGKPEFINHSIEEELLKEIPAFLHFLQSLPPVDWSVSRSGFTPEELQNKQLEAVVKESRSGLYKDLEIEIADYFDNNKLESFDATAKDLKKEFFPYDNHVSPSYINRVLRSEFNMCPIEDSKGNPVRYTPFGKELTPSKTGRPFRFSRSGFTKEAGDDLSMSQEGIPF